MQPLNLVLAGAPLDNPNKGLEALGLSVIDAIDGHCGRDDRAAAVTALTGRWGEPVVRGFPAYAHARVEEVGAHYSRRWHRPESWARVRLAQLSGSRSNDLANRIAGAHAVLDLSGGDSFTDLYGAKRLATVCAPKVAALRAGTPLVFLPQTYGPFTTRRGRALAERMVRRATLAWARDARSLDRLLELAGPDADTTRCLEGVDVAFVLEQREPHLGRAELDHLRDALVDAVGVNLSGLLRSADATRQFGLAGDYLTTMTGLVRELIRAGTRVVFVPHVQPVAGIVGEADSFAISEVVGRLGRAEAERTTILPSSLGAAELKWCIARLGWMVGSRMHSTIASLSTRVPTFGYAYSDKAAGVFETCGAGTELADARQTAGAEAVDLMLAGYERRDRVKERLETTVPPVVQAARTQLETILDSVEAWRTDGAPGSIA